MMLNKRPFINWKVVFISLIAIAVVIGMIYLVQNYQTIVSSKLVGEQNIVRIVKDETDVTSIEEIEQFQGLDTIYIVNGRTKDKKEELVFVRGKTEKTKQFIKTYDIADLYTEADLISNWKSECDQCAFKKTQLAMIEEEPLREITYIDAYNRYVFAYYSLEDGSLYEEMKLSRKYQ